MKINLARPTAVVIVMVIVIAAVAATAFRISTAPDRIRDRLNTAKAVCASSGGEWVTVEREPMCVKGTTAVAR